MQFLACFLITLENGIVAGVACWWLLIKWKFKGRLRNRVAFVRGIDVASSRSGGLAEQLHYIFLVLAFSPLPCERKGPAMLHISHPISLTTLCNQALAQKIIPDLVRHSLQWWTARVIQPAWRHHESRNQHLDHQLFDGLDRSIKRCVEGNYAVSTVLHGKLPKCCCITDLWNATYRC